jgi:hypothetical protein
MDMKNILRTTALSYLIAFLLVVSACKNSFPNKDDNKFREVEEIFESIPAYPGSQEINRSWDSKEIIARVGKTYHVDADYERIKQYYVETLERLSWRLAEERELRDWFGSFDGYEVTFSKGEFYAKLEYKGDKSEYGWDYALSVGWRYRGN